MDWVACQQSCGVAEPTAVHNSPLSALAAAVIVTSIYRGMARLSWSGRLSPAPLLTRLNGKQIASLIETNVVKDGLYIAYSLYSACLWIITICRKSILTFIGNLTRLDTLHYDNAAYAYGAHYCATGANLEKKHIRYLCTYAVM